jgi:hypothetical protein
LAIYFRTVPNLIRLQTQRNIHPANETWFWLACFYLSETTIRPLPTHDFLKRLVSAQRGQTVNMFHVSVYEIYMNGFLSGILSNVVEYFVSNVIPEIRMTIFCGPYKMQPNLDPRHS